MGWYVPCGGGGMGLSGPRGVHTGRRRVVGMFGSKSPRAAGADALPAPLGVPSAAERAGQARASVAAEGTLPLRPIATRAALIWLVSRVVYLALTLGFALARLPRPLSAAAVLHVWQQWDGNWYVVIAHYGYPATPQGPAFFPLYPMLIKGLVTVFGGGHYLLAALILSNACALALFVGFGLLAALELGPAASAGARISRAVWALLALLAYPLALYLAAPYSEALFLALAVFAFFFARRGLWAWAVACAFLAGLTRPTAVILALPLLWEYGRQHGWWERMARWRGEGWRGDGWRGVWRALPRVRQLAAGALVAAAAPLGIACYMAYLQLQYGDPLRFAHAEAYWSHINAPIWQTLALMAGSVLHPPTQTIFRFLIVLDFGALLFVAGMIARAAKRLPVAYTLYVVGLLLVVFSTPVPSRPEVMPSAARYMLEAFPIFFVLGRWGERRKWAAFAVMGVAFVVQAAFVAIFLSGKWVE